MAHPNASAAKLATTTLNVEQVVSIADQPFFDTFFSAQNWFRTAELMYKQVCPRPLCCSSAPPMPCIRLA